MAVAPVKEEAQAALVALGFTKALVVKTLDKILAGNRDVTVEELIKLALKCM